MQVGSCWVVLCAALWCWLTKHEHGRTMACPHIFPGLSLSPYSSPAHSCSAPDCYQSTPDIRVLHEKQGVKAAPDLQNGPKNTWHWAPALSIISLLWVWFLLNCTLKKKKSLTDISPLSYNSGKKPSRLRTQCYNMSGHRRHCPGRPLPFTSLQVDSEMTRALGESPQPTSCWNYPQRCCLMFQDVRSKCRILSAGLCSLIQRVFNQPSQPLT